MNTKKVLTLVMCLGLLTGTTIGMFTIVEGEGQGTANVINAVPTITQEILDTTWSPVTTVIPYLATFYYNVSVNDADGVADIENTTLTMRHSTSPIELNNPASTYRFCYNETLAKEFLIYPTTNDGYLTSFVRTVMSSTRVNYTFQLRLNQTAKDTNGANDWKYFGQIKDKSAVITQSAIKNYIMGPYVKITYWGNAGNMDFNWIGTPESNITATFNTLVTSNDDYNLNCSYTGAFQAPWGKPTFWVKYDSLAATQIPDASLTPGVNVTWYTSTSGYKYNQNLTHYIALEFPAGITKTVTYSGVTIWIQARND